MNDDELGRALGIALAGTDLRATPDAGPRLRARARRTRTRYAVLGGAMAAVVVLLLGVGLLRMITSPGPGTPAASPGPESGVRRLTTPLAVRLAAGTGTCVTDAGLKCLPAASLTVDEVAGLRAVDQPGPAATVVVTLTTDDLYTLVGVAGNGPDTALEVRIGAGRPLPAALADDEIRIRVASPADAADTVDLLGPYPPPAPRTGPGPLDVPLEIWVVTESTVGPCRVSSAGPGVLVVERGGECLVLRGPGVRLRSADLRLTEPDRSDSAWRVSVGVPPADRAALTAYTRAHSGERIVYVAGGRVIGGAPDVATERSASVRIPVADRVSAEALVGRLRP